MANKVFANGREIVCKSAAGKSMAAFPDVCFTPPQTPATPPGVPLPYPNTSMASDTTEGTKEVKISGKEVLLKGKSNLKKSVGDEAGSAPKKGVVTSTNKGKSFFVSGSMDVKMEGDNVARHLDMVTHNHGSLPANTPPWLYNDSMAVANIEGCKEDREKASDACAGQQPDKCSPACSKAQKCVLVPKDKDKKSCCNPDTTGHHLVEVHCFTATGGRGEGIRLPGMEEYNDGKAPTVCASRKRSDGSHGVLHAVQSALEGAYDAVGKVLKVFGGAGKKVGKGGAREDGYSKWNYQQARDAGAKAHAIAFPWCTQACIEKQLDDYHNKCGIKNDTPLRTDPAAAKRSSGKLDDQQLAKLSEVANKIKGVGTETV